jgi:hypothetical protein
MHTGVILKNADCWASCCDRCPDRTPKYQISSQLLYNHYNEGLSRSSPNCAVRRLELPAVTCRAIHRDDGCLPILTIFLRPQNRQISNFKLSEQSISTNQLYIDVMRLLNVELQSPVRVFHPTSGSCDNFVNERLMNKNENFP